MEALKILIEAVFIRSGTRQLLIFAKLADSFCSRNEECFAVKMIRLNDIELR
jgi:hypothetical protein